MRDQHLFLLKRANRIKHNDCLHSANGVTAVTSVRYVFTTTTNPKRLLERPPLITTPLRQSTVIFCYFHFPCDSFEAIYVVSCSLYVIPQFWFDGSTLYWLSTSLFLSPPFPYLGIRTLAPLCWHSTSTACRFGYLGCIPCARQVRTTCAAFCGNSSDLASSITSMTSWRDAFLVLCESRFLQLFARTPLIRPTWCDFDNTSSSWRYYISLCVTFLGISDAFAEIGL